MVRTYYAPFDTGSEIRYGGGLPARDARRAVHESAGAGGVDGLGPRWPEIAQTYADVNMAFGDIVKVTPSSKVVGDMAIFLVSHGMTVEEFEQLGPDHNLTLPNSVVDMFSGSLGEPEGGWPKDVRRSCCAGKPRSRAGPASTCRPSI